MMIQLEIGEEVWGYTGSPVTVGGIEWRQSSSVTRVEVNKYKANIGNRHDGTGLGDCYPTLQRALVAVGLPVNGDCTKSSEGCYKMKTNFDG